MAAGFWKRLLKSTFQEMEETKLTEEEELLLRQEGYVRRHYFFSGRVQEVGFRYTAFYLAEELGLSGWVSNLNDGRVEMELQGTPEKIELLLCRINGKGRISITKMEEEERPLGQQDGFRVRN